MEKLQALGSEQAKGVSIAMVLPRTKGVSIAIGLPNENTPTDELNKR